MSDTRLDLPAGFDPDAPPIDVRDAPDLLAPLQRIRVISALAQQLDDERKEIQRNLIPHLSGPVMLLDPMTGESILATPIQSRTIVVDSGELLQALIEHYNDEADAEVVWRDTLKPTEVDTKAGGRFQQAVERGAIPLEVVAKVAREKPSSAYIGFPKPRK